jgi:hypothetical protein
MKLPSFKFILVTLGFALCLLSASSCNKGYGCPTDFSVDSLIEMPAIAHPTC